MHKLAKNCNQWLNNGTKYQKLAKLGKIYAQAGKRRKNGKTWQNLIKVGKKGSNIGASQCEEPMD